MSDKENYNTHPFDPLIPEGALSLLIGTLPPEGVTFYFSHSSNTRLWDILKAVADDANYVGSGGNKLSDKEKIEILTKLKIGISDIIYGYSRDIYASTKDAHIEPKQYNDLLKLAANNNISKLLFVYQSALNRFLHSLKKTKPVRLNSLKSRFNVGPQESLEFEGRTIECILLPSPLNRGRKNETLKYKLEFYRGHIQV